MRRQTKFVPVQMPCEEAGCGKPVVAQGLCRFHFFNRWDAAGIVPKKRPDRTPKIKPDLPKRRSLMMTDAQWQALQPFIEKVKGV